MPEIEKKTPKADAGPDPAPDCPRCHYFERRSVSRGGRMKLDLYPPLDQQKVDLILRTAFPQRQR